MATGSDGMELDANGNLYLTVPNRVEVFDRTASTCAISRPRKIRLTLPSPDTDEQTLFITPRTAVYTMPLSTGSSSATNFTLTSPDVNADGLLPTEYTCDAASSTLALDWSGAPDGTQRYAVTMHHVASPTDIHWYWEVYDIPASVTSLPKNMIGVGTLGKNRVNGQAGLHAAVFQRPGTEGIYLYRLCAVRGATILSPAL